MQKDIEEFLGQKVTTIEKLVCNRVSTKEQYVVNRKYLLAITEISDCELNLKSDLEKGEVLHLTPLKSIDKDNKRWTLYDYFEQEVKPIFEQANAKELAKEIAKISNVKTNNRCLDLEKTIRSKTNGDQEDAMLLLSRNLFPFLEYFNQRFAHGDLHPENILFEEGKVKAIIDWECGCTAVEGYDLAYLLGCIGIIDPMMLKGDYVKDLIKEYVNETKISELSVRLLPEMVLATRILWLSRWDELNDDKKIIEMEKTLIEIISDNIDMVRELWAKGVLTKHSDNRWVMQDAHLRQDVDKAITRRGIDLFKINLDGNQDELATDLRQLQIYFGTNEDLLNEIRTLVLCQELSKKNPENRHILIERVLTIGNSCLNFGKFGMVSAIEKNIKEIESAILNNNLDELNIGYTFALRNSSIAFGEYGEFDKAFAQIKKIEDIANKQDILEIKGELARSYSNAIVTVLSKGLSKNKAKDYYCLLEKLNNDFKSFKIEGSYKVALANMRKAGLM